MSLLCIPPQCDSPEIMMPLSCLAVPSGDEMVEERGVPVQEDWSMAPDDDRVKFSLSGVAPHSWKRSRWGDEMGDIQHGRPISSKHP